MFTLKKAFLKHIW